MSDRQMTASLKEQGAKTKMLSTDVADDTYRSIVHCPCSIVKQKSIVLTP